MKFTLFATFLIGLALTALVTGERRFQLCSNFGGEGLSLGQRLALCGQWGQSHSPEPLMTQEMTMDDSLADMDFEAPIYLESTEEIRWMPTTAPSRQPKPSLRGLTQRLLGAPKSWVEEQKWSEKRPQVPQGPLGPSGPQYMLPSSGDKLMSQAEVLQLEQSINSDALQRGPPLIPPQIPLALFQKPLRAQKGLGSQQEAFELIEKPYGVISDDIFTPLEFSAPDLNQYSFLSTPSPVAPSMAPVPAILNNQKPKKLYFLPNTWRPLPGPKLKPKSFSSSPLGAPMGVSKQTNTLNKQIETKLTDKAERNQNKTVMPPMKIYVIPHWPTTAPPTTTTPPTTTSTPVLPPAVTARAQIVVGGANKKMDSVTLSNLKAFVNSLKLKGSLIESLGLPVGQPIKPEVGEKQHATGLYGIDKPSDEFLTRLHQRVPISSKLRSHRLSYSVTEATSGDKIGNEGATRGRDDADNQAQQSEIVSAITATSVEKKSNSKVTSGGGGMIESRVSPETTTAYPTFANPTESNFTCDGRAAGFYADIELGCQVYHHCGGGGYHQRFMCPNGTLYSELTQNCDFWFNIDCRFHARQNQKNNEFLAKTKKKPVFSVPKLDLQALQQNMIERGWPLKSGFGQRFGFVETPLDNKESESKERSK